MPMVLRQMALQMELSFFKLLNFSCMAIANLFFVYWMEKSFAFKLMKSLNLCARQSFAVQATTSHGKCPD